MLAFWELSCLLLGVWLGASCQDLHTCHRLGQGACQRDYMIQLANAILHRDAVDIDHFTQADY